MSTNELKDAGVELTEPKPLTDERRDPVPPPPPKPPKPPAPPTGPVE